ncbi:conserved hypothetical protein [Dinoroseobacter shibae DFL 12 = DSM 16493]|jgi:hypothetical protein|uniref:Lipoprotein n=1 Tax=Dinoroseobacter shibae (strain DSM 16493 / NCIMB 14021 / DFL 12) TaxID=398580 RepID=A8LK26_DINSH|nr:conserved hypothetical protein [Dinoroseobacter shibae DFL 12 = DSM 16493]
MRVLIVALIATATLAGCAKPPKSIAPTAVSTSNYEGYTCAELQAELSHNMRELAAAESRQRAAVAGDAVGVFLVLIPPSAFTGDASADVALNKGEDIALQTVYNRQCAPQRLVSRGSTWNRW